MNIGVIGLAFTHPYSYTQILHGMGHRVTHVWDDVPARLEEFAGRYGAVPLPCLDDIPVEGLDGIIATGRFPERADHACQFLEKGLPVYMSKPMATSAGQLRMLGETVRRTGAPLLSTSVLRFAPVMGTLRDYLAQEKIGTLVSLRAVSAHDVSMYMKEPSIWQDDPERGGGTIITMGLHALEMLVTLAGPNIRTVWCAASRRVHANSLSEDVALINVEWEGGLLGIADVPCGVNTEYFGIEVYGSQASLKSSIPKADVQDITGGALGEVDHYDEFGYTGTIAAFIEMCRTRVMPVPLEESESIAWTLLAARASAASGERIIIDDFKK